MSYTSKKQECSCGNDSYHIQSVTSSVGLHTYIVASCTECGRITGSIGNSSMFYGKTISEVVE
jgi:hypothetical protein